MLVSELVARRPERQVLFPPGPAARCEAEITTDVWAPSRLPSRLATGPAPDQLKRSTVAAHSGPRHQVWGGGARREAAHPALSALVEIRRTDPRRRGAQLPFPRARSSAAASRATGSRCGEPARHTSTPKDQRRSSMSMARPSGSTSGSVWAAAQSVSRLSNLLGSRDLVVGAVHVALDGTGAGTLPGTDHAVSFNDQPSVTIPVGAHVVSDAIPLEVSALDAIAVSVYLPPENRGVPLTFHHGSRDELHPPPGDYTAAEVMPVSSGCGPGTTFCPQWRSDRPRGPHRCHPRRVTSPMARAPPSTPTTAGRTILPSGCARSRTPRTRSRRR